MLHKLDSLNNNEMAPFITHLGQTINTLLETSQSRPGRVEQHLAQLLEHCAKAGVSLPEQVKQELAHSLDLLRESSEGLCKALNRISENIGQSPNVRKNTTASLKSFSHRILVVDDDILSREVLSDMINARYYKVDHVSDGPQAIEYIQQSCYDIIFMDGRMPEMDGYTTAVQIRQLSLERQPVIIGLTSSPLDEDRQAGKRAGMDEFVVKPMDGQRLDLLLLQYSPKLTN